MTETELPHVTVAAIVERDGRYLLVEEHTPQGLRLNNPAGHLEPGEDLLHAVARETLEETAHPFRPTALLGVYQSQGARAGRHVHYVRFAFTGELGARQAGRALDEGIVRTVWMTLEELRASRSRHRSPSVLQCALDHASGVRWPLGLLHADAAAQQDAAGAP
jgi:ADP-ribose pyrophosphatase YjhB (NUDIX family)